MYVYIYMFKVCLGTQKYNSVGYSVMRLMKACTFQPVFCDPIQISICVTSIRMLFTFLIYMSKLLKMIFLLKVDTSA